MSFCAMNIESKIIWFLFNVTLYQANRLTNSATDFHNRHMCVVRLASIYSIHKS